MILLDTHALLWWALDPGQLSPVAAKVVDEMEQQGGFASSISIWELGVKIMRGKLDLGMSIDEFARRVEHAGVVSLVPVDITLWLASLALRWDHRDPADRVIVATALAKGVPVLSKDSTIRQFEGVPSVW